MRQVKSLYIKVGPDDRTRPFWVGGTWRETWKNAAYAGAYDGGSLDYMFRHSRYQCNYTLDTWLNRGGACMNRVVPAYKLSLRTRTTSTSFRYEIAVRQWGEKPNNVWYVQTRINQNRCMDRWLYLGPERLAGGRL